MSFLQQPFDLFIKTYQQHHTKKPVKQTDDAFFKMEKVFLGVFELGLFETFSFLYEKCVNEQDLKNWIIRIKGNDFFNEAVLRFNDWQFTQQNQVPFRNTLNQEQQQFWEEQGYLKVENVIDAADCDAVTTMICEILGINLDDKNTWYNKNEKLQGLMLQQYQHPAIEKIRKNVRVRELFANLYGHNDILANCEKVSYNPPVTPNFTFKGSPLHWDMDFSIGPEYYIQGLLYLNDVPAERGAFSLIPGFQHQIDKFLAEQGSAERAMETLRNKGLEQPVPGKKGDLIVWLQAIPHAATPNHSNQPRFVQYINFTPLY